MKRLLISLVIVLVMPSVVLPTTSVLASNPGYGSYTRFVIGSGLIEEGEGDNTAIVRFNGHVVWHRDGYSDGNFWDYTIEGNWRVKFQNVNNDTIDGAEFTSTSITSLRFYPRNAVILTATGRLNGQDGWNIDVRVQDNGEPGKGKDSIRIMLWQGVLPPSPANPATYDTYDNYGFIQRDGYPQFGYSGDFPDEEAPYYPASSWGDSVRTKLDYGNIKVK